MKNAFTNRALLLALAWALPTSVLAKDTSTVTLYPVTGSSAQLVYDDIKAHAPRVAANATFAFTMIATKTDKREKPSAKACGYDKFKTSAIFNFVLPKHKSPEQLSKKTRIAWADFVFYLKTHEEGHRALWQSCFQDYDTQALALDAKTCPALDKAREKLFTTIKKSCLKQDEAYDVVFRKDVLKHPFVAEALRKPK
jgi:predicted secreted Zn-dependent protease